MKNIFLSFSFFVVVSSLMGQPISSSTYQTMIETAKESFEKNDYYNSLDWYQKAYEDRKDNDLIPVIAELHYLLRDYKKAENYYSRLFRKRKGQDPVVDPEIRFKYARVLKMSSNYDDAIMHLKKVMEETQDPILKELAQYELNGAEFAKIARPVPRLRIENAGSKVNSNFSEYSAVLTGQGEEMYYAGFNRKDVIILDGKEKEGYFSQIMRATKKDDKWTDPTPLDETINRPGFNTANVSFSPDQRRMYFTRQTISGNLVDESKIYFSEGDGTKWGAANEVGGVNGNWIAKHPVVGELFGKEVLFFVSNMPGGQGGFDIYYATYKGSGFYGDPVNLGPKINTASNEETPFYRNGTLYFSSTGHPGFGGYDIFSTVWDGTTWSEPKNLGLGYNTNLDESYFMIDKEGYHGVLLSNRDGTRSTHSKTCCDDIWEFTIEKMEVDVLVGTFDAETKKPLLGANVKLFEKVNGELVPIDEQSDPSGNAYKFPLLTNKTYIAIGTKIGYEPDTSEVFTTVGITVSKQLEQRLRLTPLEKEPEYEEVEIVLNEPLRLNNIYYDFDDDKILQDAEIDLNQILKWMGEYPEMVVELSSHTDSRGNDAYNEKLSQRRAESAKRWLVERGVDENRIVAKGYGENVILNKCTNAVRCTEEEHRYNRRTEFKILEGPKSITIKKTERRLKVEEPKVIEKPTPVPKKSTNKKKRKN